MKDHLRLTVSTYATLGREGLLPFGMKVDRRPDQGYLAVSFGGRERGILFHLETARAARKATQRRARQRHSAITSIFLNGPATPEEVAHAVDCVSPRAHRGLR